MSPMPVVVVLVLLDMVFICAVAGAINMHEITAVQAIVFKCCIAFSPIAPRHYGWSRYRNDRASIGFLRFDDGAISA